MQKAITLARVHTHTHTHTHTHGNSTKTKNNFINESYTLVNRSIDSLHNKKIENQKMEDSFKKCA